MPSASDTLTKVWGTHTLKAGFFYEWIRNAQPANNNTNGYMQFIPSPIPSPRQRVRRHADRKHVQLQRGELSIASTTSPTTRMKASSRIPGRRTQRLTLEFGLRLTHFQPWVDTKGSAIPSSTNRSSSPDCARRLPSAASSGTAKIANVPLGRIPIENALLAAALRRRLRPHRQGQHSAPRRLGPVLLSLRAVH